MCTSSRSRTRGTNKAVKREKKKTGELSKSSRSAQRRVVASPAKILRQGPIAKPTSAVQCWAHTQTGKRCLAAVKSREGEPIPIPYCERHLRCGDGALKAVQHPYAGTCLVARFDLPPRYRIAFWGVRGKCLPSDKEDRSISFYPPNPETGSNRWDGTLRTDNYNGVINPLGTGDLIQYAACPGPDERQNMKSTFQYWGKRNGRLGGLEFVTLEAIPRNTQLCHWYGAGWWSARGIKRQNVGIARYPAPKRRRKRQEEGQRAAENDEE